MFRPSDWVNTVFFRVQLSHWHIKQSLLQKKQSLLHSRPMSSNDTAGSNLATFKKNLSYHEDDVALFFVSVAFSDMHCWH